MATNAFIIFRLMDFASLMHALTYMCMNTTRADFYELTEIPAVGRRSVLGRKNPKGWWVGSGLNKK